MISIEEHNRVGKGGVFGGQYSLVGEPDVTQDLLSLSGGAVSSVATQHTLVRFYVRHALGAHMTSNGDVPTTASRFYGPGEYFRTFPIGTTLKFIAAV